MLRRFGTSTTVFIVTGALCFLVSRAGAVDFPPELGRYDGGAMPHGMAMDCVLQGFDACSGWIWIFNDVQGAVWGSLFDTRECTSGCASDMRVREIYLYSICTATPAHFGGVGITSVDAMGCPTTLLYQSGPATIVNCTARDRWTILTTPSVPVSGAFAVTVTWGPQAGGVSNPRFALDEEYADAVCESDPSVFGVFPGCASSGASCETWGPQPQRSYIYVTDLNHDGKLDDVCAIYGLPYTLNLPIPYGYASWANNMILGVGLRCGGPTAVEPSSWGRVKALFR